MHRLNFKKGLEGEEVKEGEKVKTKHVEQIKQKTDRGGTARRAPTRRVKMIEFATKNSGESGREASRGV